MSDEIKRQKQLEELLRKFSFDDLAKNLFVLSMWLPNIASPIKIQYLYVTLESISNKLSTEDRIKSYADFKIFCESLFCILPSFTMMEDYIPEPDWGDVKYYFKKQFYRIFYGGDLSNPYDYYYAYEIIHEAFEQEYVELINRSPVSEMKLCLELQDHMLEKLNQERTESLSNIMPGDIKVPSEVFWKSACDYVKQYDPKEYSCSDKLELYTNEFVGSVPSPSIDSFIEKAYRGRNCRYLFIKKNERHYPVMPRRWITVIYDTWGILLRDNYTDIVEKLNRMRPNILIGIKLAKFISDRVDEDNVFPLAASVRPDTKTAHDLIFTAVRAGDKIILIYVTPPIFNQDELSDHLEEIQAKLKESADLACQPPTRLGLAAKKKIVEFRSTKGEKALEPIIVIAIPSPLSDIECSIKVPEAIKAEIMTIDQIAGIYDEIENSNELSEFIDYVAAERKLARIPGLNSYLDMYGSFKDSHGVLVPGAIEPDRIMLDFSWGSNYRFKSLKEFWDAFPEENIYGHPRSWTINADRKTKTGCILSSRTFMGYVYCQKVGEASFFINAPVDRMALEDGTINDSIMQSIFDAIDIYSHIIEKLSFTKSINKAQVFICPSSLALKEDELAHMRHLVQDDNLWAMDCTRIRSRDYGIRVVYNKEKIFDALKDTKDRSIQIRLLIDVLEQLNTLVPESHFKDIKNDLEKESGKIARFKTFSVDRVVAFPEGVGTVLPKQREYKLADKDIANIALELGIQPGTYSNEEGKKKLNSLRSKIVKTLNAIVIEYSLSDAMPVLLEKANALAHDSWRAKAEIKASREHEVDYKRGERSSEKEKEFLHWYKVYRYLIEKFVQLQPAGKVDLDKQHLKELLAFADRLIDLYVASDFINYELYPVDIHISREYIVSTSDEHNDIASMEKEYGEEQAKLNLGIIGNIDDSVDSIIPVSDYLDKLDYAFKKDFGFGLKNFVNVQQVLALWGIAKKEDNTHYCATVEEIASVCSRQITGYDVSETDNIVKFLILKPEEILTIKGDTQPAKDVPIWEHSKRLTRFDIRPLIKIGDQYCWGPHSIDRTSRIWVNISSMHKLPSDFDAPTVKAVLMKGHEDIRNCLVARIKEIALRYATSVQQDVYPHKYDKEVSDIGDYDILAYVKDKNILFNIESKIIDPPFSNKDSGRMQRKIFGEAKEDGVFKRGYLQRVEERAKYLETKGKDLITQLGWATPAKDPKVISLFVTRIGFWWTKHPPIDTGVEFIEIRLLDEYMRNLQEKK